MHGVPTTEIMHKPTDATGHSLAAYISGPNRRRVIEEQIPRSHHEPFQPNSHRDARGRGPFLRADATADQACDRTELVDADAIFDFEGVEEWQLLIGTSAPGGLPVAIGGVQRNKIALQPEFFRTLLESERG